MRQLKNGKVKRTRVSRRQSKKSIRQTALFRLVIGLTIGLSLMVGSTGYFWYSQSVLSFEAIPESVEVTDQTHQASDPRHIVIDSLDIDVDVQPALIKDGVWQTSQTSATHLYNSARPTEAGNIVMYAHNKKELFAELKKIKAGDTINVTTADGITHTYVAQEIKIVNPSNIQEVLPTDHEVLTLYTCTGLLDSQRLVVKAFPAKL